MLNYIVRYVQLKNILQKDFFGHHDEIPVLDLAQFSHGEGALESLRVNSYCTFGQI